MRDNQTLIAKAWLVLCSTYMPLYMKDIADRANLTHPETAMALILLEEQGKLKWTIGRHVEVLSGNAYD